MATPGPWVNGARGQLTGKKVTMSLIVAQLAPQVGRTVVDRTGLTGEYDYTLQLTPDSGQLRQPGVEVFRPHPVLRFLPPCRSNSGCGWNRPRGRLRLS